ncbi:MAG: hypothetical protein OEY75_01050 [Hylemonella sp.]|nr:hypothetical protein [Hylemonella sp.]MDH5707673.1 hypothetical protein [Hylemonella sp.]
MRNQSVLAWSKLACVLCGALLLTACGGGGGTTAPSTGLACTATTAGDLTVSFTGVPAGKTATVKVFDNTGALATTLTSTAATASGLAAGAYTLKAEPLTGAAEPVVRTAYTATPSPDAVCVGGGVAQTATAAYAVIPTSNKLWLGISNPNSVTPKATQGAFSAASLPNTTTSSAINATVSALTKGWKGNAFDKYGNLWVLGGTTIDPWVARYTAGDFATSGSMTADLSIPWLGGSSFGNAADSMAFDPSGNLWVTNISRSTVYRFAATADGSVATSPGVTISGVDGARNIAFDASGNLWLTSAASPGAAFPALLRYNQSRLSADITTAADLIYRQTWSASSFDYTPTYLAFDAAGNLWVGCSAQGEILRVATPDLTASGTVTVTGAPLTDPATGNAYWFSSLKGLAFDDSGLLWVSRGFDRMQAYSTTARLLVREFTSTQLSGSLTPAFYPAAPGLPLYHSLP